MVVGFSKIMISRFKKDRETGIADRLAGIKEI